MEECETYIKKGKATPPHILCISTEAEATFQVNVIVKYSKGNYNRNGLEYFAYTVYGMDIPVNKTFKRSIGSVLA